MKIFGRTFVISGGASGLGEATAKELCKYGGHVAILDKNDERGAQLLQKLPETQAMFFSCDVLDTASIAKAVRDTVSWAKETGRPLGGIIPAAGIGGPATILDRTGEAFSMEKVELVLNINLRGAIDLIRQFLVHLARTEPDGENQERGVVIMVASSATFDGQKGQVSYAASKGAIAAMTLPMSRDLSRYGIRCVSIAPSLFESPMVANMTSKVRSSLERAMEFPRRPGKPDEFAQLARHIVENPMLNGAVIRLDGGMRMPSKM